MNMIVRLLLLAIFSAIFAGCGTTPVRGILVSSEKNIWVEDPDNSASMSYCVANNDGSKADPVCYPARRPASTEQPHPK